MSHPRKIATAIVAALQARGFTAVFAGGCVREKRLGVKPKDLDVATNATPKQIIEILTPLVDNVLMVGAQFGIIAVIHEGVQVEVATFRRDGDSSDGRHPDSVELLTDVDPLVAMKADAARRDLTINAMFEDPISGRIYDFFGGEADLKAGLIRAVGDPAARIAEDRLRMLRAVRFAASLGFRIDPALMAAIKVHAHELCPEFVRAWRKNKTQALGWAAPSGGVSWDRIAKELARILVSSSPARGMNLLFETGLLQQFMPEALSMKSWRAFQDPVWHPEGLTWAHMGLVVQGAVSELEQPSFKELNFLPPEVCDRLTEVLGSFELRLALVLHDIAKAATQGFRLARRQGKWSRILAWRVKITNYGHAEKGAEIAEAICKRLCLSNAITDVVTEVVRLHMQMHDFNKPHVKRSKLVQLFEKEEIYHLILMQHLDAMGTGQPLEARRRNSLLAFYLKKMEECKNDPVPTRRTGAAGLINGGHIKQELGLKPGRIFQVIKEAALEAQHAGEFTDVEGGCAWLRAHKDELVAMPVPVPGQRADSHAVGADVQRDCC